MQLVDNCDKASVCDVNCKYFRFCLTKKYGYPGAVEFLVHELKETAKSLPKEIERYLIIHPHFRDPDDYFLVKKDIWDAIEQKDIHDYSQALFEVIDDLYGDDACSMKYDDIEGDIFCAGDGIEFAELAKRYSVKIIDSFRC